MVLGRVLRCVGSRSLSLSLCLSVSLFITVFFSGGIHLVFGVVCISIILFLGGGGGC